MRVPRNASAVMLLLLGGTVFALGSLLLVIKLALWLPWYAPGVVALGGLGLMSLAVVLGAWSGGRRGTGEDRLPD